MTENRRTSRASKGSSLAERVFISHSSDDAELASAICDALEQADIECWIAPRDVLPGQQWTNALDPTIERCRAVLLLYSGNVLASRIVPSEISTALKYGKLIIPFKIQSLELLGWVHTYLSVHHFFEMFPHPETRLPDFVSQTKRALLKHEGSIRPQNGGVSPWRMRNKNPNFTGRADLLEQLESELAGGNGSASVVVIYGPPGFGKTSVAIEYAYRHRADYGVACLLKAEQQSTLRSDFGELGPTLGLPKDDNENANVGAVRARLEQSDGWLLILDNAERAEDLEPIIPRGGAGDIVITSRQTGWRSLAAAVLRIHELTSEEGTEFLLRRSGKDDVSGAARLAERLECNPLALEHAGAVIDETQMSFSEYLEQLDQNVAGTLEPVLDTWNVALQKVERESPEAIDLINLLAFVAPDAVPIDELCLSMGAVNVLAKFAHVYRTGPNLLAIHRSVQGMARDRLTEAEQASWLDRAVAAIVHGLPEDDGDVDGWPTCSLLLPHANAVRAHARKVPADPLPLAALLDRIAVYLRSRAQFGQARDALDEARALVEQVEGAEHPRAATIRNHLGALLRDLDDLSGAQGHHEAALAIHARTVGHDAREVADDLFELGQTLTERGDLTGAREVLERAIAIHERALGRHRAVADDLSALFDVLIRSGNLSGATRQVERAAELYRDLYGPEHPDVALAEYLIGLLSGVEAEPLSERQKLEKLVDIFATAYGEDHPKVGDLTKLLGDRLLQQKDLAGALGCYERATRIDEDKYGADHRKVAKDLLRLFSVRAALEESEGAKADMGRALSILDGLAPIEDQGDPPFLATLDDALENLGQIPGATREFERILRIVGEVSDPGGPAAAAALDYLGAELLEAGEVSEARSVGGRALGLLEASYGRDHVRVAQCLARLATAQAASDKPDLPGARASLERARVIFADAGDNFRLNRFNALTSLQSVLETLEARKALGQIRREVDELTATVLGVNALVAKAELRRSERNFEGARQIDETVLEMVEKTYGPDHPDVAGALVRIGRDLEQLRDLDGALERFNRALAILEAEYGPDHPAVASNLLDRMTVEADLGDLATAQASLERAIAILEGNEYPGLPGYRAYGWLRLGDTARALSGADEARRLYALGLTGAAAPEEAALQAAFHARLGGLAAGLQDEATAMEHLHASADLRRSAGSTDPFWEVVRDSPPAIGPDQDHATLEQALRLLRKEPAMKEHMRTFHPAITGSLPDTWFAKESMTLLAPDGQANVMASSEPLDETIDTDQYATVQGDVLRKEFPGYREAQFERLAIFGGREGYIREFEWTPPDGVPVTQIQLYYAENGRGYTATATTPSTHFPAVEVELRQLLSGLTID